MTVTGPGSTGCLDPETVAALERLVRAEHERRDREAEEGIARVLAGLPWPVRRVLARGMGR